MTRDIDAALQAETLATSLRPFLAAKFEFDSGDLRVWSGLGDLTLFSEVYIGAGDLITLSAAGETSDLRAEGARYVLSGVNAAIISLALQEAYQGRPATLYLGALTAAGALVSDPAPISKGRMDVMQIVDQGETAEITLTVESELRAFEKAPERRYTPEDQKIDFPNDLGLDAIPALQDTDVQWGG